MHPVVTDMPRGSIDTYHVHTYINITPTGYVMEASDKDEGVNYS